MEILLTSNKFLAIQTLYPAGDIHPNVTGRSGGGREVAELEVWMDGRMEVAIDRWERAMVGCCVRSALFLFSLVDPYLWIFSSRHRQIGDLNRVSNFAFCL